MSDFAHEISAEKGRVEVESGNLWWAKRQEARPILSVVRVRASSEYGGSGEAHGEQGIAITYPVDVDDPGESSVVDEDVLSRCVVKEWCGLNAGEIVRQPSGGDTETIYEVATGKPSGPNARTTASEGRFYDEVPGAERG